MRNLPALPLALAGAVLLSAAATAQTPRPAASPAPAPVSAARDWTAAVAPSTAGAYVLGNPAARVKLAEWASYTCSHCAAFATESEAVLKRMVRSGTTSVEYRHLIRDPFDLAAAVVARCGGARGFVPTSTAIFAQQSTWLPRASDYARDRGTELRALPPLGQLKALADGAGLLAIGRANGLTQARLDACFADRAGINRITALSASAPAEVTATPTFFVNGRLVPNVDWARLEPVLRDAGAKG